MLTHPQTEVIGRPERIAKTMTYQKFNVMAELRKFSRGRKTKVEPYVLLRLIVDGYLGWTGAGAGDVAACPDDSLAFLEQLYRLEDPRV